MNIRIYLPLVVCPFKNSAQAFFCECWPIVPDVTPPVPIRASSDTSDRIPKFHPAENSFLNTKTKYSA